MPDVYPRTFSHIGLSVTDLDRAVEFYTDVMGWYLIMPPTTITEDQSAIGIMCSDVFGEKWGSFRIAHLSTGDRVGVEIFEFPNAERPENNFEFWKSGIFHFCVQDPDVEGLAKKIVAPAASSACRCENTSLARSPTAWSIWRIRSETSLRSIATATS
jgi:lactoylglutathione lyase family protein